MAARFHLGLLLSGLLIAASFAAQAQPQSSNRETRPPSALQAARIGVMRAYLYYEETGRLSANIAPPQEFTAWNTIIGGGDAEEIANDLIVNVELLTNGEQNVSEPLRIVARAPDGRVIAQRTFDSFLTSTQGRAFKMLLIPNSTCLGRITVTASIAEQARELVMDFDCGE